MKTAAFASKIKTAAVAAAFVFGIAGAAAAQGTNPFVNGDIPNHNTPNVTTPNPNQGDNNQFGNRTPSNPFAGEGQNVDNVNVRLARYLVGTWQGQLTNGQTVKIAFLSDGRFAMAQQGSDVALVGRYTVTNGAIQFQVAGRCSISTRQCQNFDQPKVSTVGFRPVDGQTFSVQDGTLRRVA